MRHILGVLLALIAFAGIGLGSLSLAGTPMGWTIAYPLLLVGTIALSGLTVVAYVEHGTTAKTNAINDLLKSQIRTENLLAYLRDHGMKGGK